MAKKRTYRRYDNTETSQLPSTKALRMTEDVKSIMRTGMRAPLKTYGSGEIQRAVEAEGMKAQATARMSRAVENLNKFEGKGAQYTGALKAFQREESRYLKNPAIDRPSGGVGGFEELVKMNPRHPQHRTFKRLRIETAQTKRKGLKNRGSGAGTMVPMRMED